MLLLHHLVSSFPHLFPAYQPLLHANPDLDFFQNIVHIQAHRRQRALARLHPLLPIPATPATPATPSLSIPIPPTAPVPHLAPVVLLDLVLPLLNHFIFSSGGQGVSTAAYSTLDAHQRDRMRRSQNNTVGADHGLIEEAVHTVGLVCRALPWTAWYNVLQAYLRQVKAKPELERLLVRVVCGVVEAWHFDVLEGGAMSEEERVKEAEALQQTVAMQKRQIKGKPTRADKQLLRGSAPRTKKGKVDAEAAPVADEGEKAEEKKEEAQPEAKDDDPEVVAETAPEADEEEEDAEVEAMEDVDQADPTPTAQSVPAEQRARTLALKVRHVLSTSLLPHLHSLLSGTARGDALDLLRPSVALAIVHLLRHLPRDFFDLHFPRLLTALLSQLQRREQEARDVARKVLVDTALTVGTGQLHRLIIEGGQMLRRGYQLHVLGYLVWAVLERLVKEKDACETTGVDEAVEAVMDLVMNELVGELGREKEVDAIRRAAKEAKATKALDTIEFLCELASFEKVKAVIRPLQERLVGSVRSEEVKKLKEALRRVGEGWMRNRQLAVHDLLVYVYATVKDATEAGLSSLPTKKKPRVFPVTEDGEEEEEELSEAEKVARRRRSKEATVTLQTKATSHAAAAPSSQHNLPVVLHFALSLLHSALKHHKLHESDASIRILLDPYLPLLSSTTLLLTPARGRAASLSSDVVEVSLKVCNFLLRWPSLPSHPAFVAPLAAFLFALLQQGDAALHPALFKTMSILIQHCRHQFTSAQLGLLFSFIREAMLTPQEHSPVFPLLHAVLTRKWLHPDLYDVMDRTAHLLVTSPSASVRQEAATLFLLFLLDYPVGVKRMRQHLTFLVQNLGYTVVAGRMAVVDMMESVVVRFPRAALDEAVELLWFPLCLALMNEEAEEVRGKVGRVMTRLLGRVSADKAAEVEGWVGQWMEAGEGGGVELTRRCAAMQCYGFMVEGLGEAVLRFVPAIIAHFTAVILEDQERAALRPLTPRVKGEVDEEMKGGEEGGDGVPREGDWRLLYFALVTLEKAMKAPAPVVAAFATHLSPAEETSLWPSVVSLLLHPGHVWIRTAASRLLSGVLAASPGLTSAQTLRLLKVSCMQLDGERLTEKVAGYAVSNLKWLAAHSLTIPWDDSAPTQDAESEEGEEGEEEGGEGEEKKAPTGGGRPSLAALRGMVDQTQKNRGLNWAFHRLSYMTRQPGHVKRTAILAFYRHVVEQLPVQAWTPYLLPLLHSLFRLANQTDYDAQTVEVKAVAAEVLELVQQRVDGAAFLAHYNAVRGGVMELRRERRDKRKAMAVVHPAVHARRKVEKQGRKKESRKRKMEGVKLAKGIAGIVSIDRPRSEGPHVLKKQRRSA